MRNRVTLRQTDTTHLRLLRVRGLLVIGVVALFAGCMRDANPTAQKTAVDAAPVVTSHVQSRNYARPIEAIATARAAESVVVTSRVSGRVSAIYLQEGKQVHEGDPLVLLEDDAERAELRSATAAAQQAKARYERMAELTAKGMIARDALDAQRQVVDTADAALELARVMLGQRTIRAPFSGALGFRQVSPGALVQPGTSIVTLDAMQTMRVAFSVPESVIADINVGDPVAAQAVAYRGKSFTGTIRTIGTRLDETTRALPLQALIQNADGLLKPGMMLTLAITTKPRSLRYVPEAALAPENAAQFVWRVNASDQAEKVPVELGVRAAGWVEILSGLEVGERIVLEGSGNLKPGRAVREVPRPTSGVTVAAKDS